MMFDYIYKYLQERLKEGFPECKSIPFNSHPTKKYTIIFDGWAPFLIDANDNTLNELFELSRVNLQHIIQAKKDTHAFSEPNFIYKPYDSTVGVEIGTMELELYEKIMEKKNDN